MCSENSGCCEVGWASPVPTRCVGLWRDLCLVQLRCHACQATHLELVLILCQKKRGSIECCLSLCNAFFGCGSPILSDLLTGHLEKSDLNLQKCNRCLREVLYMLGEL